MMVTLMGATAQRVSDTGGWRGTHVTGSVSDFRGQSSLPRLVKVSETRGDVRAPRWILSGKH